MSEYQYYEFQAVDRPLTPEQMSELRARSSRAQITPSSFVNVYNWGDFKGNPEQWMEKYFDAFLYLANWGSRWFMLRLPEKLLDQQMAASHCDGEILSCRYKADSVVLSFRSESEDSGWVDGEGWLTALLPIRSEIIQGDHRALYLGWLLAVQSGELEDDTIEPPVPPGLGDLNASLDSLAHFFDIDSDLIAAAAEGSPGDTTETLPEEEICEWILNLPSSEKEAILVKLIHDNDPHLAAELRQRALLEIREGGELNERPRRTAAEIRARAESMAEMSQKQEAEQRAREKARREREQAEKRRKHLESLAGRESALWRAVEQLIAVRQPKRTRRQCLSSRTYVIWPTCRAAVPISNLA